MMVLFVIHIITPNLCYRFRILRGTWGLILSISGFNIHHMIYHYCGFAHDIRYDCLGLKPNPDTKMMVHDYHKVMYISFMIGLNKKCPFGVRVQ